MAAWLSPCYPRARPLAAAADITHAVNVYKPSLRALLTIRAAYPKAKADPNAEGPLMRAWAEVDSAILLATGDDRNAYPTDDMETLHLLSEALRLMPLGTAKRADWCNKVSSFLAKRRYKPGSQG